MSKRTSRILGLIMLVGALALIGAALAAPNLSFPWSNTVTYTLYLLYLGVMILLLIAPFGKK